MSRIKRILALGLSQSNFLSQLYGDLCSKYKESFAVSINNYYDLSKGQVKIEKNIFSNYYNFEKQKISRKKSIFTFLKLGLKREFWEIFYFEKSQGLTLKEVYFFLKSYAHNKAITEKYILPLNFDVYHFHFCTPDYLKYIHFIPNQNKIICSFWGSDLLRSSGLRNLFYVTKALEKANLITVQTPELAQIIFAKYGRKFQDKTKIVQFTQNTEIYQNIDDLKKDESKLYAFKKKYNIPQTKLVIGVGHNGFKENMHIKILKELQKIPSQVLSEIIVVLHFSYGEKKIYTEMVKDFINKSPMDIIIIYDFLGPEEMASLRISTEIMIHMPISDALSGAMTEVMYAGNQVFAGAWLPYGILRRKGICFEEVGTYEDIPSRIIDYIENKNEIIKRNSSNREAIINNFFPDKTTSDWNNIFQSL